MIYQILLDNNLKGFIILMGIILIAMVLEFFIHRDIQPVSILYLISILIILAISSSALTFEYIGISLLCTGIGLYLQRGVEK